jgi:hypothetical protein
MARCPQCNLLLSGYSANCPRCGSRLPTRFRFWIGGIITILFLVLLLFGVVRSGKWANLASNNSPEFKSDQIANEIKKDEEKRKRPAGHDSPPASR